MTKADRLQSVVSSHNSSHVSPHVSRRTVMASSAALLGGVGFLGNAAQAADPSVDPFMRASSLLIQHKLNREVGRRLAGALQKAIPTFNEDVAKIIQTAESKNAKTVEDFYPALTDEKVRETAQKIIFAWYAGVLDATPTAQVYAFELALMYQTTKDANTIPSYAFSGPNNWADINPALADMPDF